MTADTGEIMEENNQTDTYFFGVRVRHREFEFTNTKVDKTKGKIGFGL